MSDKTDGPAFPHVRESMSTQLVESGMTLRDYFAAKALGGIIASNLSATERHAAKMAYEYADCMLKERGDVK